MIINLTKSKMFTVDPSKRFAKEFNVDEKVWTECWFKYKLYGFSQNDLRDYVEYKTGRKPSVLSINRWVVRTEIYSIARKAFKMNARIVQSYFFEEYEKEVLDELLKNMKSSATKSSRTIV
jgi:hypothetical protein